MTQQSSRCSGSAMIGELSTSSTVTTSRQHRVRIMLRVVRRRDLDPGELLAGGAVLMHVAHGAERVDIGCGQPVGEFEVRFRLVRVAHAAAGGDARLRGFPASVISATLHLPSGDGLGRMAEPAPHRNSRRHRWSRHGGVWQTEIVGHRHRTRPGASPAQKKPSISSLRQPRILDRALGDFGMQLRGDLSGACRVGCS